MGGRTCVCTDVRTVDDVMAIKPRFLASMGYHIFLTMVLRACAPSSRAELRNLRNRKHVPCFYRVIETRVKVWENEKCCGNTSRRRVFPQLFRVNRTSIHPDDLGFHWFSMIWETICLLSLHLKSDKIGKFQRDSEATLCVTFHVCLAKDLGGLISF